LGDEVEVGSEIWELTRSEGWELKMKLENAR
jgi:hypothetical protein